MDTRVLRKMMVEIQSAWVGPSDQEYHVEGDYPRCDSCDGEFQPGDLAVVVNLGKITSCRHYYVRDCDL